MITAHSDELKSAIVQLKEVGIDQFSINNDSALLTRILERFSKSHVYKYPIWDNLKDWVGIDYKFSWEWFPEILPEGKILFFFDPSDDNQAFIFRNAKQLVNVLNNCYRFTFYITDDQFSFLFCYNDHDNLIACGSGKKWLTEYPIISAENVKVYSSKNGRLT